jgi:hypothetical protein
MGTIGGTAVGLGSRVVVFLDIAQQVKDGLRIAAAPGEDRREQQAHLG